MTNTCPCCGCPSDGLCNECLDAVMREAPEPEALSDEDLDRLAEETR